AGDIAHLRLSDIDWKGASIQVCGKGRRQARLPLSQEVGQAIVTYLKKAGRGPKPIPVLSFPLHPLHPLPRIVLSRLSSTDICAVRAWCAPVEGPRICFDIRSQHRCCGKAHRCKISPPSCATALSKLLRSTPKWTSHLCGKSHKPGRR